VYPFRVGELDCAVVNDGDLLLPPEIILPPSRRDEWPPLELDVRGFCALPMNCLLVRSRESTALIDTGNGTLPNKRWEGGGNLLHELLAAGVQPSDVDLVVLTHTHADHAGGATVLRDGRLVPTFPRARYVVPKADWDFYTAPDRAAQLSFVRENLLPLAEFKVLDLVEGDSSVTPQISMVQAPGHTPGLSVVVVSSGNQTAIHLGDLVHHRAQFEKPDLVRDDDVLPDLAPRSRERIGQLALERDALVVAMHEAYPGLGRLARDNGRILFRPLG